MSMLQNKTVVLTGASMGIGRALALELAARGTQLVLGARTEDLLAETAAACRAHGTRAAYVAGDVSDPAVAGSLCAKAADMGGFFGFIHAAGVLAPGPWIWELSMDRFRAVMDASVTAGFALVRAALPILREQGEGLCVFFGSGAANRAQPGIAAYCVAKAAEEHLMRQVAAEAPEILSLAYQPGVVETRMQEEARGSEGGGAEELKKVFVPWKERGELLTPEQAAWGLLDILDNDPWRWQGQVTRVGVTK